MSIKTQEQMRDYILSEHKRMKKRLDEEQRKHFNHHNVGFWTGCLSELKDIAFQFLRHDYYEEIKDTLYESE